MISERAVHDMVMETIAAARDGKPMPDFGDLTGMSRVQIERLNRAYEETRNRNAARRWKR